MDDWKYKARGPSYSGGPDWYYLWSGELCTNSERPIGDAVGEANAKLMVLVPKMLAFIRRVAREPIGSADATVSDIFTMVEAEARALLAKIEEKEK